MDTINKLDTLTIARGVKLINKSQSFVTNSQALAEGVEAVLKSQGRFALTGSFTEVYFDLEEMDYPQTNLIHWVSSRGEDVRMDGVYRYYDATGCDAPVARGKMFLPDLDTFDDDIAAGDWLEDEMWMTDEELAATAPAPCSACGKSGSRS